MRKLKLFFACMLLPLLSIGQVWATDVTYTFTSKSWADASSAWTGGGDGNGFTSGQGIQVTTGTSGANATSKSSFSNVSKVVVTYNTNKSKGAGSIVIKIGTNNEVSNSVAYSGSSDGTSANFTTQFDFSPVQSGAIKITTNTTTNSIWVKSITITYDEGQGGGGGGTPQPSVSLEQLALNPASIWLAKGGSVTLSPVYTPDNATNKSVSWSTSDDNIATVTSAGVVTASNSNTGTATITCTSAQSSSIKATCTVTVANGDVLTQSNIGTANSYSSWSNKKGSANTAVYAGYSYGNDKIQIKAESNSGIVSTTSAGKIKNVSVTWNASNTTERTIDIYGNNTAYTSTEALYSNTASVKGTKIGSITYPATTCTLSSGDYEYVGVRSNSGTAYLNSVTFFWEAIPTHTLTYGMAEGCGSMGSLSATVGGNTVTSGSQVNEGASVTLVPTINSGYEFVSYAATAGSTITNNVFTMPASDETITLTLQAIPLTALTLNESSLDLAVNDEVQLSVASVTPSGALTTVNWSTSDGNIATVSASGLVKAKGDGTATITATSTITGTVTATCTVTVTTPEGIADPTLTLADNVSHNAGSVVKVSNHSGDYYYAYTLDGTTTPALDANLDPVDAEKIFIYDHTNGITLSATCTLKIVAYDIDGNHSDVVTKNYTINPAATVKLYENTQLKTTLSENLFVGSQIATRPSPVSATLGGKTFVGWCASTADPTSLIVFPYTITGTETVWHAVYATLGNPTFTKLSSNSFDSQKTYVLGAEQSATDNTLWFKSTTYTVNENESWGNAVQASASNIAFFTLSGTASALVAQDAAGNYIVAPTANKNFMMSSTEGTLALQNDGTIQAGETYYVRYNYNNNAGGFRSYNSVTAQPAYFYEYTAGSVSGHITSVTSHAITEAECTNGSVVADVNSASVATTITITAAGSSDAYDLLAFDVYKTADPTVKVDVTVDENDYKVATFSMPDYPVTVSASFIKVGTAENPLTVAELIASQANLDGYYVYAQGIVSQLGSFNSTNGYYTYYFSADGTTTSQFEVYNGYKGSHQVDDEWYYDAFSAASDLALGDEVIVEGYIKYFNNTKYQFEAQNSELTYHCRPVVVTKGAEDNTKGTFTITANEESITSNKKYCLAELSGANDLTVTVVASPAEGYRLKSITSLNGETEVGTVGDISNNTCTITGIKASTTITANFEQVFAVALTVDATGTHQSCSATINGGAGPVSVAAGETIYLVASLTDSENDEFVNFTATTGITITSTGDLTATATTTQAGTITANFRPLADPHTITNGGVNAAYGTIVMKDMGDNVAAELSLRPDKTGKLIATETAGYRFTGWTVTPANAVTFADATAMETTFAAKNVAATISATYEARTAFTVQFMNGNTQIGSDETVYDGRTIDLLGAQTSFDANHSVFCGWVTSNFVGVADAEPTFVAGAQTITGNTTFYAVYGNAVETNNYKKITTSGELESGKKYLIVSEYNNGLEAMHGAVLSKDYWIKSSVVTETEDVITTSNAEQSWQISITNNVADVYNANANKHLALLYVSNQYYNSVLQADAADLSIAVSGEAWNISGVNNNQTVYLKHSPSYSEFIGSDAAAPLLLYKQVMVADEWVSKPVEYVNVYFKTNAGEEAVTNMPDDITNVEKGYSLTAPAENPARGGYNFVGWNTDNEATEAMSFPQTINENTDVYAIWQAYPDCAIDLYVNGVKDDNISTSVKQGAELDLSAIDAPERLGYEFLGWAATERAEENTTAIDIVETYTPTPNEDTQKSFYAVYTRQEGQAQYEKASSISAGKYLIVCEDQKVALDGSQETIDGAGHIFGVDIDNAVIAYSADIDAKTFTIAAVTGGYSIQSASGKYIGRTSDANGMEQNTTTEFVNTITITSGDANIVASGGAYLRCNPNSGSQWFRYYKSSSYTGQKAIQLYKYVAPTTYYTTNPAVKYSVSYDLGDGAWRTGEGCDEEIVAKDGSYDICTDVPVLADYIFTNWTIGEEAVTEATITITGTTEIVANYRAADHYTLNYDANGAIGTAPAATTVKEGAEYTVLANSWFFKSGYSFAGWNTKADGTGDAYAKDASLLMPSGNVTLYAQWSNSLSESDVIIVAHYGDDYYAMGQTLSSGQLNAVQVQMLNGKVRDVAEENRAAITWHMIVNSSNNTVSFYSPANEKYLGISSNNLAYADEAVEWTWDNTKKCYKIGAAGTRTFWYRNSDATSTYNCFKYYSTGNVGASGYASEMILAYGFAVTIDGDATESAITVGDDVVVTEDATLTINNERVLSSMTVEAGGKVVIDENNTLNVNSFIITANPGQGATSGQVINAQKITAQEIFMDVQLVAGTLNADFWYGIAAPFDVDVNTGIYLTDGTQLINNTHVQVWSFEPGQYANGGRGWKRSTVMERGKAYLIGFDQDAFDAMSKSVPNVVRLKANGALDADMTAMETHTYSGVRDYDWNGFANPNLHHIDAVNAVTNIVQVFENGSEGYGFQPYDCDEYSFVVGAALFVKYIDDNEHMLSITNATNSQFQAPARTADERYSFCLQIRKPGSEYFDNQMYVRASETAAATYESSKDMETLNETCNGNARIWTNAYGKRLAVEEAPLVNNQAIYDLTVMTPAAGTYVLRQANEVEGAQLYVTYEGAIVWNLSLGDYEMDLVRGTTTGYGLLLVVQPNQMPTGVENGESLNGENGVQKILLNGQLYILRDGHLYDAVGKEMK